MSLKESRMPSLRDKLEGLEVEVVETKVVEVPEKKIRKSTKKKDD